LLKELFEFNRKANCLIKEYLEDFKHEVSKFKVKPEYLEMLMFDVEHFLKFFGIKSAKKRGSSLVEEIDIYKAIKKLGKPDKLVKSQLKSDEVVNQVQNATFDALEWMKRELDEFISPTILDAGCGWGRVLLRLYNYSRRNFQMVGVDVDDLSLKYGKYINKPLNVVKSDVRYLPFRRDVFSLILCSGVIHEVKTYSDRERVIEEFYRVLKPKGALCIIDAFSANALISIFTRILQHLTSKIEWIFPKSQLDKILKKNRLTTSKFWETDVHLLGLIRLYVIASIKEVN